MIRMLRSQMLRLRCTFISSLDGNQPLSSTSMISSRWWYPPWYSLSLFFVLATTFASKAHCKLFFTVLATIVKSYWNGNDSESDNLVRGYERQKPRKAPHRSSKYCGHGLRNSHHSSHKPCLHCTASFLNIARIANAVQCHSLSGSKDCPEFRFSIVRIVISVSNVTSL